MEALESGTAPEADKHYAVLVTLSDLVIFLEAGYTSLEEAAQTCALDSGP